MAAINLVPNLQELAESSSEITETRKGHTQTPGENAQQKSRTKCGHKRLLLQYNNSNSGQKQLPLLQGAGLQCDFRDAWGHTLPVIDTKITFRVFLQNPNGLNPTCNNYLLLKDLHTCAQHGAAAVCLPATNLN